jgi:hypothetical protein
VLTGPWAFRVIWATLAVGAGPALAESLSTASRPVQVVASLGLWAGWAGVLLASLVPRASSLTVLRLGAPAPLVATAAAALHDASDRVGDDAVALGLAAAVAGIALLPTIADAFVDGSSYGAERRFALRTPPSVLLGPAPMAWLLAVGAPATAALLLAAESWIAGGVLGVAGAAGIRLGVPALHRLSRRWLVFVPAGVVVHDRSALPEPVLLPRRTIARLGPALAGSDAHDLTLGATGLALELAFTTPVELAAGVTAERALVAPLRPGAVVAEARDRGYAVATAAPTTSSPS